MCPWALTTFSEKLWYFYQRKIRHLLEVTETCDGVTIARGHINVNYWLSGTRVMTLMLQLWHGDKHVQALSAHVTGQLKSIKHMNTQPVKLIRSVYCQLHFIFCVCRADGNIVTDIQTQVCERSRVLKWAAGAIPGGLDKHLVCYLNLIWIWMRLVFAGISWMLTLRINLCFIEFASDCQQAV